MIAKARPGGEIVLDFYPMRGLWTQFHANTATANQMDGSRASAQTNRKERRMADVHVSGGLRAAKLAR
ncbi:hypothetical protein H9L13_06495 [Sphingomonas lutea]|uniref:Uncharacterized protein n=2 Tax=Sphingomonas lutea TaxID=1045317 RepID=A0A7G9SEV7_9SPHN|nr:hypothetical protein [Sphingomonas lutea]QNN66382.1 hypothetical protein H9L13_06495 [Sphingomonas lutea]